MYEVLLAESNIVSLHLWIHYKLSALDSRWPNVEAAPSLSSNFTLGLHSLDVVHLHNA